MTSPSTDKPRPRPPKRSSLMSSGLTAKGVPAPWRAVLFVWENLPLDLPAGLTVALVALPQAIAYAMLAGVPPVYGLSTAVVTGFLAAVLGKSRQVATGPTTTTGLLILGAIRPYLGENGLIRPEHLSVLATLALLAGVIRLVVAFGGGAHLVRFLPESVLVGFTAGAGTLIGGMQLDEALGLPPTRTTGLRSQADAILDLLRDGQHPEMMAVVFALGTILTVVVGRRVLPRLPVALAAPSLFGVFQTPPKIGSALVVGISQSGQSPDIVSVIEEGRRQGALTLAITNDGGSPLAEASELVIETVAGPENAVAATNSRS